MSPRLRSDQGSALSVVLIFVTVVSIALSGSLMLVQANAAERIRARQAGIDASELERVTADAVSRVSIGDRDDFGISANCGLPAEAMSATTESGIPLTLTCEPEMGSGSINAVDAIIVTGASEQVGGEVAGVHGGVAWTGTGDGFVLGGPNAQSSIRNRSALWNGNAKLRFFGPVYVPTEIKKNGVFVKTEGCAGLTYEATGTCRPLPPTQLDGEISAYQRVIELQRTKLRTARALATVQTVPSCSGSVTLKPGVYDSSALAGLNALSSGSCTTVNFDPGTYFFTYSGTWVINSTTTAFVGTPGLTGQYAGTSDPNASTNGCVYPEATRNLPDRTLETAPNGVQWEFSGPSKISVTAGTVDLCPINYRARPQLSIVQATDWTTASVARGDFLSIQGSTNLKAFHLRGTLYAPDGGVYIDARAYADINFDAGAYIRALAMNGAAGAKVAVTVSPPRAQNGDRVFALKVKRTDTGEVIYSNRVHVVEEFGLNFRGVRLLEN